MPGASSFTGLTHQQVYAYAKHRGLTDDDIKKLNLRAALKLPTGKSEVMGPWLVFPVRVGNRDTAWQGRRLRDGSIKYLSSKNIHDWLWPLDSTFFDVYRTGLPIVLVEGVFDAKALLRYGVPALCTFGKSISDLQILLLKELYPGELIFLWDADASKDSVRSVRRVAHTFPKVSVVNLVDDSLTKKVDAGDALQNPQTVVPWLSARIKKRMDVRSPEFFQWQMSLITS